MSYQQQPTLSTLAPELLLNIVGHLEPKEICLLQRVNKRFQALVSVNNTRLAKPIINEEHDRLIKEVQTLDFTEVVPIDVALRNFTARYGSPWNKQESDSTRTVNPDPFFCSTYVRSSMDNSLSEDMVSTTVWWLLMIDDWVNNYREPHHSSALAWIGDWDAIDALVDADHASRLGFETGESNYDALVELFEEWVPMPFDREEVITLFEGIRRDPLVTPEIHKKDWESERASKRVRPLPIGLREKLNSPKCLPDRVGHLYATVVISGDQVDRIIARYRHVYEEDDLVWAALLRCCEVEWS